MAVAREGHPHLPPGREPGPQSRRTSTGRTFGGCAAPAFVVAGVVAAAMVAVFGVLLASLPGGPPPWPFFLGAVAVLGLLLALRAHHVARRPSALRDGHRAAGRAPGAAPRRPGARPSPRARASSRSACVCTQSFDVWRRIGDDSRSRVTDTRLGLAAVGAGAARRAGPARRARAAGRRPVLLRGRLRLASAGRSSCAASARSAWPSPCPLWVEP